MIRSLYLLVLLGTGMLFLHCGPMARIHKARNTLNAMIRSSGVFNRQFTGFVLYDPQSGETLCDHQGSRYFIPASNTKLLTLYTALNVLGDSLPSFKYIQSDGTLTIKGMGDPTLLHPLWPDHNGLKMLMKADQVVWINDHWMDESWGSGWAWDDYAEAYQAEKSDLPVYGNLVRFKASGAGLGYEAFPPYFQDRWTSIRIAKGTSRFRRLYSENEFGLAQPDTAGNWYLPFRTDPQTIRHLLEDTLGHTVRSGWGSPANGDYPWKMAYGVPVDSVYAEMMKKSDNFIAEQLLMVCSAYLFDTLNSAKMIDYARVHFFPSFPDTLQWVDGSGLSRYNLITPRSVVYVLDKIKNKMPFERIQKIFPAGGVSGTLARWYPGQGRPYVYAKTGSLSNNHALSGYILTQTGRVLIFSFMHSNYIGNLSAIRGEMKMTLEYIRDHF